MIEDREYDVVIVGSGAGGGTVAQELASLARNGSRVLVLEQGPRLLDEEFTGRELDMAPALYEDGGGFLTADGTMTLAFGRAYGGSTVVYTGTSLIAPERVIRRWHVPGLSYGDVERRSRKYMAQNNVHELAPELINDNNRLFVEGCRKPDGHAQQFPLNLKGCRGSSLCNLGCPNAAKLGTNRVQLPNAERSGVEVVTRAEALEVSRPDGHSARHRAHGRREGGAVGMARGEYRVRADIVVLSGGPIGTSALLLRSGIARASCRAWARASPVIPRTSSSRSTTAPITNDVGHPKSFFVDRAEEEGFVLETCMYFPFTTAKNLTGFGAAHSR